MNQADANCSLAEMRDLTAAEFFAGIGLMRLGLEEAGISTRWANDIEADKRDLYVANFGDHEFVLDDVRQVKGQDVPAVDLATASFPCTDLSLAGNRSGLGTASIARETNGGSSMFWEFARVVEEMETRPSGVLLENVLGFASSNSGVDLRDAVYRLNDLGYSCDLLAIDARHFVPQSRPRMFIVGLQNPGPMESLEDAPGRPNWIHRFARENRSARLHASLLPQLPNTAQPLSSVVDRSPKVEWWDDVRVQNFVQTLSSIQLSRLDAMRSDRAHHWRTAYRRTRAGRAVWEIRADSIAGCLRTARGGSSKQAIVSINNGIVAVRWMTPKEYARLMGAPNFKVVGRGNQALFGFGDAVCVPVIEWLCRNYVTPALTQGQDAELVAA